MARKKQRELTQAGIARELGLSRARVCQMVKMGMPVSTIEEARTWRAANLDEISLYWSDFYAGYPNGR